MSSLLELSSVLLELELSELEVSELELSEPEVSELEVLELELSELELLEFESEPSELELLLLLSELELLFESLLSSLELPLPSSPGLASPSLLLPVSVEASARAWLPVSVLVASLLP